MQQFAAIPYCPGPTIVEVRISTKQQDSNKVDLNPKLLNPKQQTVSPKPRKPKHEPLTLQHPVVWGASGLTCPKP